MQKLNLYLPTMAVFNLHKDISNDESFMSNLIDSVLKVPDHEKIELNISSFGGDVMLGMPLGETLARHKGLVVMSVDGICGSMGAFLLTYADEVKATSGAAFMFHKAAAVSDNPDDGSKKIVGIVNDNFRKRMEDKGMDEELISSVFDKGEEIYLNAFEAKHLNVIDKVVKNERKNNSPLERIVADFKNILNFKNKKMSDTKKTKLVFVALMNGEGEALLTAFETPDGVISEGTMLMPLNGQPIVAGVYTFEGNAITIDAEGKVTAVQEIAPAAKTDDEIAAAKIAAEKIAAEKVAADIEAKKHDDDEKVTAETVKAMVETAVTGAVDKLQTALEASLAKIGSGHIIKATFESKDPKIQVVVSDKVAAKAAEKALKVRVEKKLIK